jgi:antitoxin VapB
MALNIKSPEVDRLARDLAARTGESITDAVKNAITERLSRIRSRAEIDAEIAAMKEITHRIASLPDLTKATDDEIIGYNEFGGFDPW